MSKGKDATERPGVSSSHKEFEINRVRVGGSKVEAVAEDGFGYEVVGRAGEADPYSEIDLPLGGQIQVNGWVDLVLLQTDRVEISRGAKHTIVFEATGDFFGEVITEFDVGRKDETLVDAGAMKGLVERRIEGEVPFADLLVDDGPHLPRPSIRGILGALVADFVGKTQADGPFPFWRNADARANVIADVIPALAIVHGSEDIKAGFEPISEAMGDFDGLMQLMIRRIGAVGGGL